MRVEKLGFRFEEALKVAARLHGEQPRRGTTIPYISHLLSVAALVIEDGGDEDEAIAALLHDAVEEQGGAEARETIRRRFGERVLSVVDGCTDVAAGPDSSWRVRKQKSLDRLRTAIPEVVRVSLADKLHNARCILADHRECGESVWKRFHAAREEQLWFYRSFIRTCRERTQSRLLDALEDTVRLLEALAPAAGNVVRLERQAP